MPQPPMMYTLVSLPTTLPCSSIVYSTTLTFPFNAITHERSWLQISLPSCREWKTQQTSELLGFLCFPTVLDSTELKCILQQN